MAKTWCLSLSQTPHLNNLNKKKYLSCLNRSTRRQASGFIFERRVFMMSLTVKYFYCGLERSGSCHRNTGALASRRQPCVSCPSPFVLGTQYVARPSAPHIIGMPKCCQIPKTWYTKRILIYCKFFINYMLKLYFR